MHLEHAVRRIIRFDDDEGCIRETERLASWLAYRNSSTCNQLGIYNSNRPTQLSSISPDCVNSGLPCKFINLFVLAFIPLEKGSI